MTNKYYKHEELTNKSEFEFRNQRHHVAKIVNSTDMKRHIYDFIGLKPLLGSLPKASPQSHNKNLGKK